MNIIAWIKASRPITLVASIAPVISATFISNNIDCYILLFTLIAAVFIQIGTNFINDLIDFIKGADDKHRLGPARMVQSGLIARSEMKVGIFIVFLIAFSSGIYLVFLSPLGEIKWPIIAIGLTAFIFAYLYTGTKYSLAYIGLGEIFVYLYFGIISVMGTVYLQDGVFFNKNTFFLGSAIGCINIIFLVINNIRDYDSDRKVGKNTLVVCLGRLFGKFEILVIIFCMYLFTYLLCENCLKFNYTVIICITLPICLSIIYDAFTKIGRDLNFSLFKTSCLLTLYVFALYIGKY